MARSGLSAFQIRTAAEALLARDHREPTNDQVRDYLGGGSLSTISPVMQQWRAQRKGADRSGLSDPLLEAVQTLRAALHLEVVAELQAQQAVLDQTLAAADEQVRIAQSRYDIEAATTVLLREQVAQLQQHDERLQTELAAQIARGARAESALETVTARHAAAEVQLREQAAALQHGARENATLQEGLREARQRELASENVLATARDQITSLEAKHAIQETELQRLRDALAASEQARQSAEEELQREREGHAGTHATLRDTQQARQHDRDALELQLRQTMVERGGLRERLAEQELTLEAERARHHTDLTAAREQLAALTTQAQDSQRAFAEQIQHWIDQQATLHRPAPENPPS